MMPLAMAHEGDTGVIREITGRGEVREHLEELGLAPGAQVRVASEAGGSMILIVEGRRIALDKTMAMRIMV